MSIDEPLTVWVIYKNPKDHPGMYVVRGQDTYGGVITPHPRPRYVGDSLSEARASLPAGLIRLRIPEHLRTEEDPVILETWI